MQNTGTRRKRYDLERLLLDADMATVAKEIGIKLQDEQKTYSNPKYRGILCPNPEHQDKNFGNCVIKSNNTYVCFACGDSGNVIHMVQQFCECSFWDAMGIIADICGGREAYLTFFSDKKDHRKLLSKNDQERIGIYNCPVYGAVRSDTDYHSKIPGETACLEYWTDDEEPVYLLQKCLEKNPLMKLLNEEPEVYQELVIAKALETMERYRKLIKDFSSRTNSQYLIPDCKKEIEAIEDILLQQFGESKKAEWMYANQKEVWNGQISVILATISSKEIVVPF